MFNITQIENRSTTVLKSTKNILIITILSSILLFGGCIMNVDSKINNKSTSDIDEDLNLFICDDRCGCDSEIYNPDFEGNHVLVTLTKENSAPNKEHCISYFGDNGIIAIRDMMKFTNNIDEISINLEEFRQIYLITLDKNCKKNVLNVVERLKLIDGIDYAEPSHYVELIGV